MIGDGSARAVRVPLELRAHFDFHRKRKRRRISKYHRKNVVLALVDELRAALRRFALDVPRRVRPAPIDGHPCACCGGVGDRDVYDGLFDRLCPGRRKAQKGQNGDQSYFFISGPSLIRPRLPLARPSSRVCVWLAAEAPRLDPRSSLRSHGGTVNGSAIAGPVASALGTAIP